MYIFTFLKNIYNYLIYFYSLYKFLKYKETKYNNIYLQRLEKAIYNCGPIGIKLVQLLIMYDGVLPIESIQKLKYTLEKCKVHSWDITKKLYFDNFKKDISDDFDLYYDCKLDEDWELDEECDVNEDWELALEKVYVYGHNDKIVGSGSIGQVYKLFNKELDKYVAVKVRHPTIEEDIHEFTKIANFIMKYILKYIDIPYKNLITLFVENINIQKDFKNEALNTIKLRANFIEDNIIVPEIYNYSTDFIIMSYHKGVDISAIDNKYKFAVYNDVNFMTLSSIMVYDFLHADLHDGNIKIELLEDNKYNIIIYDCGLVVSTNKLSYIREFIFILITAEYYKFPIVLNKLYNDKNDKAYTTKIANMAAYIKDITIASITPSERAVAIMKYTIDNNLIIENSVVNLLISNIMSSSINKKSADKIQKFVNIEPYKPDIGILLNLYTGIMDKTQKFKKLNTMLKDYINMDIERQNVYKEWSLLNFGHTDKLIIIDIICKYFGYY